MNIRDLSPAKRLGALAATGVLALSLAACGDEDVDESIPPPGTTAPTVDTGTATPTEENDAGEHNEQDRQFLQDMIPHHREALEASEILLAKEGVDPEAAGLAEEIRDSHQADIEQMTGWLEAWGETVPTEGAEDAGTEPTETAATTPDNGDNGDNGAVEDTPTMDGPLLDGEPTQATPRDTALEMPDMTPGTDLSELREAPGEEAALVYLEFMTGHHEDAVDMAEEQTEDGQNTEVVDFAQSIVDGHQAQIDQMEQIKQRLEA